MFSETISISNIISYIAQLYSDLTVKSTFIPTSPKRSEAQITEHMSNAAYKFFTIKWTHIDHRPCCSVFALCSDVATTFWADAS